MNNEEAIKFGKEQLEIFGEDSRMSEFIRLAIEAFETVDHAHNSLLNEEESERLLDFIGNDTGLHERAVSDLNDTVADMLRKCMGGDE